MGAGGGMLWLGWWAGVSEVGSPERKPKKPIGFSRFLGGQEIGNLPLVSSPLPASRAVFFKVLVPKPRKTNVFLMFLELGFSTSPQKLVYYVNKR